MQRRKNTAKKPKSAGNKKIELKLTSEESNILYHLCRYCVGIMDSWHPYPSTELSKNTGLTLYRTRKALKKLKEIGLVYSFHEGGQDDEGRAFCYHGYGVTKAAESTEEYKRAYEEERRLCLEVFGMDIGGV